MADEEGAPPPGAPGEEKPNPDAEGFVSKVPKFPWEIDFLAGMIWWIEKQPDGTVLMKIAPRAVAPNGQVVPLPPAVAVGFSADGWARFKRDVEFDGDAPPAIQTATMLPPFPQGGPTRIH